MSILITSKKENFMAQQVKKPTVQHLQMLLKALEVCSLRNQFSIKTKTMTALALLQVSHQILLKKKDAANHPKFRDCNPCAHLSSNQDTRDPSTIWSSRSMSVLVDAEVIFGDHTKQNSGVDKLAVQVYCSGASRYSPSSNNLFPETAGTTRERNSLNILSNYTYF